jgi:hypothetical protein
VLPKLLKIQSFFVLVFCKPLALIEVNQYRLTQLQAGFHNLDKGLSTFFLKRMVVNILSIFGHSVSVRDSQLCCYSITLPMENTKMIGCSFTPQKLYLQTQVEKQIWSTGYSSLKSVVVDTLITCFQISPICQGR